MATRKRSRPSALLSVAVGYARTSPEEARDPVVGLDAQVRAIEAYAQMRGLRLVATYQDDGVLGSAPLEARPGGAELIDRLGHDHERLALIVLRLERMFASASEAVAYLDVWEERGVVLHVLDLAGAAVDTRSPIGRFALDVLRAARDMEQESQRGRGQPGAPARGSARKPLLGERVVRGYIIPDANEQRAVERIQELAAQGKSLRLIAEALDQEGVPTKRRAKQWSKEAIRLIMQRIDKGEVRSLRAEEVAPLRQERPGDKAK